MGLEMKEYRSKVVVTLLDEGNLFDEDLMVDVRRCKFGGRR